MIKNVIWAVLSAFCLFSLAQAEEAPTLDRIDAIRIHVISHKVDVIESTDEGEQIRTYEAATASPKNAKGIPYGKIGRIWRIILNPSWFPPDSIKEEYAEKGKPLPDKVLPGKNNPLGKIKLFISHDGVNSSLGIHNTNEPKSIGKRVTHGCTRMGKKDVFELAAIILEQNGYDADELFQEAAENPKKSIVLDIDDGPTVVHLKD